MRAVAALPASALVCGSALALSLPDVPLAVWGLALGAALGVAGAAWHTANPVFLTAALTASFGGGGCLLAADAWQRAWRPPLREAFDAIVAHDRRQAEGDPRRSSRSASEEPDASVFLIGALREDAAPGPNGVALSLAAQRVRHPAFPNGLAASGGVLISVGGTLIGPEAVDAWRAGRTVALPVQLRRAARYLNEGAEDAERSLARRGTTLVGSAKSAVLVETTAAGSWPAEASAAARRFIRRRLANHVATWSPRSAAIVGAIIIGDRSGLDDEATRRLQEAGTYHVIAISGGNIAILVALALLGFRVSGMLGRGAMLTAAASLAAYAYIVGGGRSVERATLTAVIFLVGRAIDQRGAPVNVVAASGGILVAANPLALTDPGFLLTFGATIGILAIAGKPVTREESRLAAAARSILRASIGAEAMLLPIGAVIFSRVTFAGIALNFAAIPLMAVAQVAGMALVPVSMFWPAAATALGWLAHVSAEGLIRSSALLDWAPWLAWRVAPPSSWVVASYYAALVAAWALWKRGPAQGGKSVRFKVRDGRSIGAAACACAAAAWIVIEPWQWAAAAGDGRLRVTFIDVGQGDATSIRFPDGQTLLVDAGGLSGSAAFDIGERVVAPVLRRQGVVRLDRLALTHGDADHVGGAASILEEFRPREVWEGIPVPRLAALQALRSAAERGGAPWRNVQGGDRVLVGGVEVAVRHPAPPDWERQDVRNEDSIVIELVWRDVSIWLAGDVGAETEPGLAAAAGPSRLRIVKVPHHGSLTSSSPAFVRSLSPRAVIASAGRHNTFGHPAPAVLDRYRQIGASVFRTDQDGAVTVVTDGRVVDVETVSGRRGRYR